VKEFRNLKYAFPITIAGLVVTEKLKAQYTVNPFVQPNDTNLTWHGSGDVNLDKALDWDDYSAMQGSANKEADIDGDGIPGTENDKQILEERLNNERDYLPLELNKLKTHEERKEYAQKLSEIYGVTVGDCEMSSTQTRINLHGFGDLTQSEIYDLTKNGLGNAPFYDVWIFKPGDDHAATCMALRDSVENLNSWYISDPSHGNLEITQEKLNEMNATEVWIQYSYVNHSQSQGNYLALVPILKFKPDSEGVWKATDYQNPEVNLIKHRKDIPTKNLEKEVLDSKIKICPNPVSDIGKISYPQGKTAYFEFYDMFGRMLKKIQDNDKNGETEIDFSNDASGFYPYRLIDSDGNVYTGKAVKE